MLAAICVSATPVSAQETIGSGTGFYINFGGWAVTNAHVVEGCSRVETASGQVATDVRLDNGNDLAAVRFSSRPSAIVFVRRSGARLGEDIAAFGYPLSSVLSTSVKVTTGNVNSLMGLGDDTRFLQISTPIQPGNSGGPVVDRKGSLLGVTTATLKPEAGGGALPQNVNFAVRASLLQSFLESRSISFDFADQSDTDLSTADLAEKLEPAVVQVLCFGKIGRDGTAASNSSPRTPPRRYKVPLAHTLPTTTET